MSFAVIQTGGKQYKVKAGEILKVEKLEDSKENSKIEFKEITGLLGTPQIFVLDPQGFTWEFQGSSYRLSF